MDFKSVQSYQQLVTSGVASFFHASVFDRGARYAIGVFRLRGQSGRRQRFADFGW